MFFRLDRTAFYAGTHEENARYHAQHQPATMVERLRAAAYLNSVAYGYDLQNPPKLDRTAFSTRQHAQQNG
jgi:hypothetical protein